MVSNLGIAGTGGQTPPKKIPFSGGGIINKFLTNANQKGILHKAYDTKMQVGPPLFGGVAGKVLNILRQEHIPMESAPMPSPSETIGKAVGLLKPLREGGPPPVGLYGVKGSPTEVKQRTMLGTPPATEQIVPTSPTDVKFEAAKKLHKEIMAREVAKADVPLSVGKGVTKQPVEKDFVEIERKKGSGVYERVDIDDLLAEQAERRKGVLKKGMTTDERRDAVLASLDKEIGLIRDPDKRRNVKERLAKMVTESADIGAVQTATTKRAEAKFINDAKKVDLTNPENAMKYIFEHGIKNLDGQVDVPASALLLSRLPNMSFLNDMIAEFMEKDK